MFMYDLGANEICGVDFSRQIWILCFFPVYKSQDVQGSLPRSFSSNTLPETNIAPENGWLEYYFPFGMAYVQVLC